MNNTLIQIRLATIDDLLDVQTCARSSYSKYVGRIGQKPAPMIADFANQIAIGQVHVALWKYSFAGYVVFYPKSDHIHLENVAVLPA